MSLVIGIIIALLVFFLVVLVHECGHFFAARMTGMRVHEFGFGIPPKLATFFTDKKGTEFTLNWLPIGGFVRIAGEDARSSEAFRSGGFMSKSLISRLIVLVAGVTMNFLFAWVIFTGIFMTGARPLSYMPIDIGATNSYFMPSFDEALDSGFITHSGIVLEPLSGSIAETSGILAGDHVIAVNETEIDRIDDLITIIQKNLPLTLTLEGTGGIRDLMITPEDGKIGSMLSYMDLQVNIDGAPEQYSLGESIVLGAHETYATSILTLKILGKTLGSLLFPHSPEEHELAKNMLSGPIGVGSAFITMVDVHVPIMIFVLFTALLSVNLGVLNILPFPALDGGRMVTTIFYSIFSFSQNAREKMILFEGFFHMIGFCLLMLLMLYVAFLDIGRIF